MVKKTKAKLTSSQQSQIDKVVQQKLSKQKNKSSKEAPSNVYRIALSDPFSYGAQGARVPDMYSCPTATRHITRTFTLISNSSGEFDCIVLPSCYQHIISPRGSLVGGSTWTTLDGGTVATGAYTTPTATLSAQLLNYRIVSYGVKIYGLASMTNNSGKVIVGTVPISSNVNDKNATVGGQTANTTNSNATVGATLSAYGVPAGGSVVTISSLPNLPNSMETSMINLSERPLTVLPKITGPRAFEFKQTYDEAIGFNVVNQTTLSNVMAGDASYLSLGGFEAVVIGGTGCPATTNMLEVEVIYHIEGNPYLASATSIGSDSTAAAVDPISWMKVISDVASHPSFKMGVQALGDSFYPGLGTLANRLF